MSFETAKGGAASGLQSTCCMDPQKQTLYIAAGRPSFSPGKGASEKTPIPPFVPRRPIISRCHRSVPGSWPRGTRGGVVPTDRQQIFPPSSEHQRPLTAVQRQHTSRHVHKRFYAIVKTKTAEDSRTPPNGP